MGGRRDVETEEELTLDSCGGCSDDVWATEEVPTVVSCRGCTDEMCSIDDDALDSFGGGLRGS